MEEITSTPLYIYRNCFMLEIDPSGWKGSVPYGLGADISLPPCLATGIWNLVPKATSGPKSRGASLGTKLWRHVQRYCAQFLAFMVIYGNLVLYAFCIRNRKYPKIGNGNRSNRASDFTFENYITSTITSERFEKKSYKPLIVSIVCNCVNCAFIAKWLFYTVYFFLPNL